MTGPLTEQARALREKVSGLSAAVEQLDDRTNRSERITIGVIFGLVLELILSIAVAIALGSQVSTDNRLQEAIDREAITREESLCPLFGLLLGSYNPGSRKEGPERDAYIRSFQVMRAAYEKLDCTVAIVPPRSDQPAQPVPSR